MLCALFVASLLHQQQFERVPLEDNPAFGELAKGWIKMMPTFGVTGFSIVVINDGRVVLLDGYGLADAITGKKANLDTRYYIASITKAMTATAIAQLAEQGKIDLDAPVQHYLPRFDLKDHEYAKTVTVRDLLCHKPGILGDHVALLEAYTGGITDDRFYRILANSEPSKRVQYSNTHFTILGRVIEAVTGKKWQDYLAENVFGRIGMSRTTAYVSDLKGDTNLAPPFENGLNGPQPVTYMKTDRTMHAAGGVFTTARDMARFMTAFLNEGKVEGKQLLSPGSVRNALSPQSTFPMTGSIRKLDAFGYAWILGKYRDYDGLAAHEGGYKGYSAFMAMMPGKKMGMAAFVNTGGAGAEFVSLLMVDVFDKILGYPLDTELRSEYKAYAQKLYERMKARKPVWPNPAFSGMLSLDTELYTGHFENDLWGDIEVRYIGGYLTLSLDDLPQQLKSTGMDEFTSHDDPADEGTPCRFIVHDGRCIAIEANFGDGWIRFDRQ